MIMNFYDKDGNRRVLSDAEAALEVAGDYPHLLTIEQGAGTAVSVSLDKIMEYFDLENNISLSSGQHVYKGDVLVISVTGGTVTVNGAAHISGTTFIVPEGKDVHVVSAAS